MGGYHILRSLFSKENDRYASSRRIPVYKLSNKKYNKNSVFWQISKLAIGFIGI